MKHTDSKSGGILIFELAGKISKIAGRYLAETGIGKKKSQGVLFFIRGMFPLLSLFVVNALRHGAGAKKNPAKLQIIRPPHKSMRDGLIMISFQYAVYALCLGSSETDNFLRPFFRLLEMMLRPLAEDILSLKPCLFFLFLLDG